MKQGQGSKRTRGRSGGRRGSNRQTLFDSNGPSVRIRGNAFQVHEKYLALARDAAGAGDRVAAENYYQHAEHYFRIYSADQEERAQRHPGNGQMPDQQRRQGANGSGQPQNYGQSENRVEMNGANGAHSEEAVPASLAPESTIELSDDDDEGEELEMAPAAPVGSEEGGQKQGPSRRSHRRRRPVSND